MTKKTIDLQEIDEKLAAEEEHLARGFNPTIPPASVAGGESFDPAQDDEISDDAAWELQRKSDRLKAVRAAQKRIRDGVFGTCELCDAEIAVARLLNDLTTRYCIRCQRELERMNGNSQGRLRPDFSRVEDSEPDMLEDASLLDED